MKAIFLLNFCKSFKKIIFKNSPMFIIDNIYLMNFAISHIFLLPFPDIKRRNLRNLACFGICFKSGRSSKDEFVG